ncbi:molecular chaperone DnaK [Thermosyntropha lipolytica DSM 11003]|uniref:Molecular chaperone DnaK n=1 Tax=Thermosyntropha lipolytica DSM 11003 TaxID=1123382 RepID=A0A1M5PPX5_9FIRM|nr:Hsp70 family protein [Thermosyntropha lipolytica]SHH03726.1 molecular chaperone DnaK [Thermosyntropha lipolytica DSM 11003]
MADFYLGIDLGTTNTVAALGIKRRSGEEFYPEVIRIPQYDSNNALTEMRYLPSVLYVDHNGQRIVGKRAKDMRFYQSGRTIANSKRYIGQSYRWEIDGQVITPCDVAAEILKRCRRAAEEYTRKEIKGAVITVPASFNNDQIYDTIRAAEIAGFNKDEIVILPEPTASLIYFVNKESVKEESIIDFSAPRRIMVFDIGGGTCDIAVVEVSRKGLSLTFRELAVGRYEELGGIDFDFWAADYLFHCFIREHKINPEHLTDEEKEEMFNKLVVFAEEAKESISSQVMMNYLDGREEKDENIIFQRTVPEFYQKRPYEFVISKKEYDQATERLYQRRSEKVRTEREARERKNIIDPVYETLSAYRLTPEDIDFIYMTGGMSRYQKLQKRLEKEFGKGIFVADSPTESVANGAAIYHYYNVVQERLRTEIMRDNSKQIKKDDLKEISYDIINVLAEAIMIDVENGLPEVIIPAQTPVPYEGKLEKRLKTTSPSGIKINLYGGQDAFDPQMRIQKSYVAKFSYPVESGTAIDVEYKIDKNKILSITMKVKDNPPIELTIERDLPVEERRLDYAW